MNKSLKIGLAVTGVIVLVGAGIYAFTQEEDSTLNTATPESSTIAQQPAVDKQPTPTVQTASTSTGRYSAYSESAVADASYNTTVVFFYAPWCPECRAFKKAINEGPLPDGVQILETDFDSSTDLKKRYGVTLQTTFVRVNSAGDLQKKWAGYGQDKSLANLLENIQ